jgi:hypothetical protein
VAWQLSIGAFYTSIQRVSFFHHIGDRVNTSGIPLPLRSLNIYDHVSKEPLESYSILVPAKAGLLRVTVAL